MPNDDEDVLALEVEELELLAELQARDQDLTAGLVPAGVQRSLYPHELRARTNFAALELELDTAEATIAERLAADREAFLKLLEDDLGAQDDAGALVDRIVALDGPVGLQDVTGAKALVTSAVRFYKGVLTELAMASAGRARSEAAAQGEVLTAAKPKLTAEDRAGIDRQALRLAQGPLVDVVRALREQAFAEVR